MGLKGNDIIPETDLSQILEPEANASGPSPEIENNNSVTENAAAMPQPANNSNLSSENTASNESINNATSVLGQPQTTPLTTIREELRHNDFIFRVGTASNYKELMVINATTGEVRVKKLKAELIEADNIIGLQQAPQLDYMTKVNGSVIIRLG